MSKNVKIVVILVDKMPLMAYLPWSWDGDGK
jgi:hypothetical protein